MHGSTGKNGGNNNKNNKTVEVDEDEERRLAYEAKKKKEADKKKAAKKKKQGDDTDSDSYDEDEDVNKKVVDNYYEILGIGHLGLNASDKQIKTAYQKAVLKCHPDKMAAGTKEEIAVANVEFGKVQKVN